MKKGIICFMAAGLFFSCSVSNVEAEIYYGDVNSDGVVNARDRKMLDNYMEGLIEFTEDQKKRADINLDGVINEADKKLMHAYAEKYYVQLPVTNYALYGDVNEDGEVNFRDRKMIYNYLEGISELSLQQQKNADINNDGVINEVDSILMRACMELPNEHNLFFPITDYNIYGDINMDGEINARDVKFIRNYIDGVIELSNQEKKNADVNNDGKIDETDISLVQERINGNTNVFLQYRIVDGDLSSILPKITSVQPMPKPTPTPSTKPTSTPSETTIPTSNPISDSRPSSGSNSNSQVSVDNLTSSVENKTERSKNILYLVVSVVGVSVIGMIGLIFKKVRK